MTSIAIAAADPVAFATRALSRAGQDVHAAAAGLLAAGVSLRRPTDREVMLEFASGVTSSTTIRWVRTPEGGEISVNNPGQPYCPPGIPKSVLGDLKLGRQPAATSKSIEMLMEAVNKNPASLMSGSQNTGLHAQQRLAHLHLHLHRQLTRWVETWDAHKPGLGRQARYKLETLGMAGLDCRAQITAERDPIGNVVSVTVETGPDTTTRLEGALGATIVAPATEGGVTAVWSTSNQSQPDGNVQLSNAWKTLAEYWNLMAAETPGNAVQIPTWPKLMRQLGNHPCWKALKLPDARWYDEHSWEPWPDDAA